MHKNGVRLSEMLHRVAEFLQKRHYRFSRVKKPHIPLNKNYKYPKNIFFEILGAREIMKKD